MERKEKEAQIRAIEKTIDILEGFLFNAINEIEIRVAYRALEEDKKRLRELQNSL